MNKKIANLLMLSLSSITLVGAALGVYVRNGQDKLDDSVVVLNGETQKNLAVSLTGFYPTLSKTQVVNLSARQGDAYNVTVDFEETGDTALAEFLTAEVKVGETVVGTALLKEYLEGKEITFDCSFDKSETVALEITYSMGMEIGDEAQNTEAYFDVVIKAER